MTITANYHPSCRKCDVRKDLYIPPELGSGRYTCCDTTYYFIQYRCKCCNAIQIIHNSKEIETKETDCCVCGLITPVVKIGNKSRRYEFQCRSCQKDTDMLVPEDTESGEYACKECRCLGFFRHYVCTYCNTGTIHRDSEALVPTSKVRCATCNLVTSKVSVDD